MPLKQTQVPAEIFMQYRGVTIYKTYENDLLEKPRSVWYARGPYNSDNSLENGEFDGSALPNYDFYAESRVPGTNQPVYQDISMAVARAIMDAIEAGLFYDEWQPGMPAYRGVKDLPPSWIEKQEQIKQAQRSSHLVREQPPATMPKPAQDRVQQAVELVQHRSDQIEEVAQQLADEVESKLSQQPNSPQSPQTTQNTAEPSSQPAS